MRKVNKKGFTLIELLAVIIILGLLMAIAIPSVTRYIDQSRKKTLVSTIDNYIGAAVTGMNNGDYKFDVAGTEISSFETNTLYAIPVGCISLEKGGGNPYGTWGEGSYVLVVYSGTNGYRFGFQFRDSSNHYMPMTAQSDIKQSSILQGDNSIGIIAPTTDGEFEDVEYIRTASINSTHCSDPWRSN